MKPHDPQGEAPLSNAGDFDGEHAEYGSLEKAHLTRPEWLSFEGGPLVIRDRSGRFFTGTDPFNNSESDEGFTLEGAEALLAALTKAVADAGGDVHSDAWEVRQAAVLRGPIERLKPVVRTHFLKDKTVEVALVVEGEVVHSQAGRLIAVAAIGDSPEGRLAALRVDFDELVGTGEQGGAQ